MRVGPQVLHTIATFDTWIGMSLSMMPPCIVARGDVDSVDDHAVALGDHTGDLPFLADVLAGQDPDAVALLQLHPTHGHKTSGASDTIRMNLRSRSSRPTGPKMRVPRGCIWSLINTAAFSSKRM